MRYTIKAMLTIVWIVGIVLAKGFWSTLVAVFIIPWAWYIAVEHIMELNGWLY